MQVQVYISFDGRCQEAVEFYQKAVGAEVLSMMHFKNSPDKRMMPPGADEKIMHVAFQIGETTLMASDGECGGKAAFSGINLSLAVDSDDEAKRMFSNLAEGGTVVMPITKTFFSSSFGMLVDRFGVNWMVVVPI